MATLSMDYFAGAITRVARGFEQMQRAMKLMPQNNNQQEKPKCEPKPEPKVDKAKLDQSIKDKQKALNNNQTVRK